MSDGKEPRSTADTPLDVSIDHIWPTGEAKLYALRDAGEPRARRAVEALLQVAGQITDGDGECAACRAPIATRNALAVCSVAHFSGTPPLCIGIPFCARCATSEEEVSRLARVAVQQIFEHLQRRAEEAANDPSDEVTLARMMAEADFRKSIRAARKIGMPQSFVSSLEEVGTTPLDARTAISLLTMRDALTKRDARQMAEMFRKARARSPQSPVALTFAGFDDDPRELWQFPEVCRYLRWWVRFAELPRWEDAQAVPWVDPSWGIALLLACGVYGDDHPVKVNLPPTPTVM
jgi:hypothetical protein